MTPAMLTLGGFTLLLILLKMFGAISWSWAWVLAPTWIPLMVCFFVFVVFLIEEHRDGWR